MVAIPMSHYWYYECIMISLIGMAIIIGQISDQNRGTVPGRGSQMLVIYNMNHGYTISQFLG